MTKTLINLSYILLNLFEQLLLFSWSFKISRYDGSFLNIPVIAKSLYMVIQNWRPDKIRETNELSKGICWVNWIVCFNSWVNWFLYAWRCLSLTITRCKEFLEMYNYWKTSLINVVTTVIWEMCSRTRVANHEIKNGTKIISGV